MSDRVARHANVHRFGAVAVLLGLFACAALPMAAVAGPVVAPQVTFTDAVTLPAVGPGPRRVTVCVIDSGTDPDATLQHALTERLGVDDGTGAVNPPGDRLRTRHGTLVSQVVAGNGPAVRTGIWPLAKLRTVSAINRRGRFNYPSLVQAVDVCLADPRVLVINLSLGRSGGRVPPAFAAALLRARQADINVVVSAGNVPDEAVNLIDSSPGVISVGGIDAAGKLCSTTHSRPDVLGLACAVLVTDRTGSPILRSGTSYAAPQAAAILAALRGHAPTLRAEQASAALLAGAKRTSFAPVLNARGALRKVGVDLPPADPLPRPLASARRRGSSLVITVRNRPAYAEVVVRQRGRTVRRARSSRLRVRRLAGAVQVSFELGGVRSPVTRVAA